MDVRPGSASGGAWAEISRECLLLLGTELQRAKGRGRVPCMFLRLPLPQCFSDAYVLQQPHPLHRQRPDRLLRRRRRNNHNSSSMGPTELQSRSATYSSNRDRRSWTSLPPPPQTLRRLLSAARQQLRALRGRSRSPQRNTHSRRCPALSARPARRRPASRAFCSRPRWSRLQSEMPLLLSAMRPSLRLHRRRWPTSSESSTRWLGSFRALSARVCLTSRSSIGSGTACGGVTRLCAQSRVSFPLRHDNHI